MKKVYLLKVMFNLNDFEHHYENVYSNIELAKEIGEKWLENELRKEYEDWFEKDIPRQELSKEQLFKLKTIYDFSITEFDLEYVDKLNDINNLPVVADMDIHDSYCANLEPAKIEHSYDYNGKEIYISGIYFFRYEGKRKERKITIDFDDFKNPTAGTKFKKGDIVKINQNENCNYNFNDKLHVITDIPYKKENQIFFNNTYRVIVNHNSYDEGCHVDIFHENELELFTGVLPKDSPIVFLSKYFKGEIKINNIKWMDIECGHITLNESRSFRDVPEIIEQLKGEKDENRG